MLEVEDRKIVSVSKGNIEPVKISLVQRVVSTGKFLIPRGLCGTVMKIHWPEEHGLSSDFITVLWDGYGQTDVKLHELRAWCGPDPTVH